MKIYRKHQHRYILSCFLYELYCSIFTDNFSFNYILNKQSVEFTKKKEENPQE